MAGITGLLSVVDVNTGTLVHEPVLTRIEQVEWLTDNRTVVTAEPDTQVVLYDADRALVRASMPVTVGDVEAQTFLLRAGDGQVSAVVRGHPGRTYPLDPQLRLDRACAVARRDLTRDE